jgi:hypothetical protein
MSKEAKESVEEVVEDAMKVDQAERLVQKHKADASKNEDVDMEDASLDVRPTRRGSVTSTPRTEPFPEVHVSRTRGRLLHKGHPNRSGDTSDHSASAYERKSRGRRKSGSGAHILKQIASFNRSPDADRRRDDSKGSDMSEDDEHGRSVRRSQPPRVTTVSRNRRDGNGSRGTTSSRQSELSLEPEDEPAEVENEAEVEEMGQVADEEEVDEAEDADEPKYCYCGQGSFGEMIACDNDDCPMEWFHLGCTGLRAVPGDNGKYTNVRLLMYSLTQSTVKWFCDVCKEPKGKKAKMMASRH